MKEFMLPVHNEGNSKASFSPEMNHGFLNACRFYIEKLTKSGNFKRAQPEKECFVVGLLCSY
jgi:hypothetical protein